MMFDPKLLDQAIKEIAEERLKAEIREWFVMTAPPHFHEVFARYNDLVTQENKNDSAS